MSTGEQFMVWLCFINVTFASQVFFWKEDLLEHVSTSHDFKTPDIDNIKPASDNQTPDIDNQTPDSGNQTPDIILVQIYSKCR